MENSKIYPTEGKLLDESKTVVPAEMIDITKTDFFRQLCCHCNPFFRIPGGKHVDAFAVIDRIEHIFKTRCIKTFYDILGAAIALVLGGSQALSRSVFSLMIPKGSESEYFSLYEISERGTSWLGPLLFGLALQFTGSYRIAIVSLVVFFVLGLGLLSRVNVAKAQAEAGN